MMVLPERWMLGQRLWELRLPPRSHTAPQPGRDNRTSAKSFSTGRQSSDSEGLFHTGSRGRSLSDGSRRRKYSACTNHTGPRCVGLLLLLLLLLHVLLLSFYFMLWDSWCLWRITATWLLERATHFSAATPLFTVSSLFVYFLFLSSPSFHLLYPFLYFPILSSLVVSLLSSPHFLSFPLLLFRFCFISFLPFLSCPLLSYSPSLSYPSFPFFSCRLLSSPPFLFLSVFLPSLPFLFSSFIILSSKDLNLTIQMPHFVKCCLFRFNKLNVKSHVWFNLAYFQKVQYLKRSL